MSEQQEVDEFLPQSIKSIVYSFSTLIELLDVISKLSKMERQCIITSQSRLLTQNKILRLRVKDDVSISYNDQFLYALTLATEFEICVHRFNHQDIFLMTSLLELIRKQKCVKGVNLWIAIDQPINTECFRGLVQPHHARNVKSVTYQIQTFNHHEKMIELFRELDFPPKVVIDCSFYHLSGLFTSNFPKVLKTKQLVCKLVGNNFDFIVKHFTNLEQLTYISQHFIQIEQNFKQLKQLKHFNLVCESQDETIEELSDQFQIQFFQSKNVSVSICLSAANLTLQQVLTKLSKLNVKSVNIRINQLKIGIQKDNL